MNEENKAVQEVKKKRGRPVGWRGTYKKRVKAVPEVPQETKEQTVA